MERSRGELSRRTFHTIVKIGSGAVPHLAEALSGKSPETRSRAAWILAGIGPAGKPALEGLIQALDDEHPGVVSGAARALGNFGADAASAVPALARAFERSQYPREEAAALAKIAFNEKSALQVLLDAMQSDSRQKRMVAIDALGAAGPVCRGAIPALAAALRQDPDSMVRHKAVEAVGKIASVPEVAIPALVSELVSRKSSSPDPCARAIAAFGEKAVPALRQSLSELEDTTRSRVVGAIALGGLGARALVPALVEGLRENNRRARLNVIGALARLGPETIPDLIGVLSHEDARVREGVVQVIRNIGTRSKSVGQALIGALEDPDPAVRKAAGSALRFGGFDLEDDVPGKSP